MVFWLIFVCVQWLVGVAGTIRYARIMLRSGRAKATSVWRAVVFCGLLTFTPLLALATVLLQESSSVPIAVPVYLALAVTIGGLFYLQTSNTWNFAFPTLGSRGTELPPLQDHVELAAVHALSTDMGVSPPLVFLLPRQDAIFAQAWSLSAPAVIVSQGFLNRLPADERAGIFCHELAHFENGSLWIFAAARHLGVVATILAMLAIHDFSVVLWGCVLTGGLLRILSRILEFDCDRRAALCVGNEVLGRALRKVHAGGGVEQSGWRAVLVQAASTHPSLEIRLAALTIQDGASPEDAVQSARRKLRRSQLWNSLFFAAWVWLLAITAWPAWNADRPSARLMLLLFAISFPSLAAWAGLDRQSRHSLKWNQTWTIPRAALWVGGFGITTFILVLSVLIAGGKQFLPPWLGITLLLAAMGSLVLSLGHIVLAAASRKELNQQLVGLLSFQNWPAIQKLARDRPGRFKAFPECAAIAAEAFNMTGDHAEALERLQQITRNHPRYSVAWHQIVAWQLEHGDMQTARLAAEELVERFPQDYSAHLCAARCERLRGNLLLAEEHLIAADLLFPDSISGRAERATLLLTAGKSDEAQELITRCEADAPGDDYLAVLRCWCEVLQGPGEDVARRLEEIRERAAKTPWNSLGPELILVQALSQSRGLTGGTDPVFASHASENGE